MRVFIIIVGILLCIGITVFVFLPAKNADKFTDIIEIESPVSKSHLYIKKKVWGMTAEDQLILISTDPARKYAYNKQTELIYHGIEPFLYKLQGDSLTIYTYRKAGIPAGFHSDFKIVQHEMDSVERHDIFEHEHYKELGFQVVSK